ncbi:MAG: hypothetical protein J7K32_07085 [Deltaproteobacteria bacterium]|nr:hypothetical protein [Deltaproteobacteria bacterium]
MLSRAEGLEQEQKDMKELSIYLTSINKTDSQVKLDEAKNIITKLRQMNLRWNISALDEFLNSQYKELFMSA